MRYFDNGALYCALDTRHQDRCTYGAGTTAFIRTNSFVALSGAPLRVTSTASTLLALVSVTFCVADGVLRR